MNFDYPKVYLYRRIVQAKLFIDTHYADKIAIDNLADEAHFSKFHFIRLFKSIYGKTPHQYLKSVRIQKAQNLLQLGYSISRTCFLVGFDSLSSFSGLFKTIAGETPSNYAHRYRTAQNKVQDTPLAFVPACYAYQHGWLENSNFEEMTDQATAELSSLNKNPKRSNP